MGVVTKALKEKDILEEMKGILKDIKNELNFAEAKNMALFTFEGLVIFKLLDLYKDSENFIFKVLYLVFGVIWLIPMCKTIVSFIPNTSKFEDNDIETDENRKDRILIFYGDISKYKSSKTYVHDIYKKYGGEDLDKISTQDLDYSKQILFNSKIVNKKYELFRDSIKSIKKIAIGFVISSIILNCTILGFDIGGKVNSYKLNNTNAVAEIKK